MSQVDNPAFAKMQVEVLHLRQELQTRDQLLRQLSEELFCIAKEKSNQGKQLEAAQPKALQQQLQAVKQQLACQHRALASRNAEIRQMQQALQKLNERNHLLEQAVQEIPEVYRRRYAARVEPIKQRIAMLQQENQQLQARLETSYHLVKKIHPPQTDLASSPQFPQPSVPLKEVESSTSTPFSHKSGIDFEDA